jgi:hypothetical protein
MSERISPRRRHAGRRRHQQRELQELVGPATCRLCGCTDDDCEQCVMRTGSPCHWVQPDLCSACAGADEIVASLRELLTDPRGVGTIGVDDLDALLESYRGEAGR